MIAPTHAAPLKHSSIYMQKQFYVLADVNEPRSIKTFCFVLSVSL